MNKNIFKYQVGDKSVFADPLLIEIRLRRAQAASKVSWSDIVAGLQAGLDEDGNPRVNPMTGDPVPMTADEVRRQDDALEAVAPILEKAFNVGRVDEATGEGLTIDEMVEIFGEFNEFQAGVKKNTETRPSLPELTPDCPSVSSPSSPTDPARPPSGGVATAENPPKWDYPNRDLR